MSELMDTEKLAGERVYFVQLRTNNQITVPKEAMDDKDLSPGDVLAIAVIKLLDSNVTWEELTLRLGEKGGETD